MSDLVVKRAEVLSGEVLAAPGSLEAAALEYAMSQASLETRRTYVVALRRLAAITGESIAPIDITPTHVIRLRDQLTTEGLSPSTIAVYLSAVRGFAAEAQADPRIQSVKAPKMEAGLPKPLSPAEIDRLLKMPDRRTMRGARDFAILKLLLDAGPRASELANLDLEDVEERQRALDGRLRAAISDSTVFWLRIHAGKRGKSREVPLTGGAVKALAAWRKVRPKTPRTTLFLSQPRAAAAGPTPMSKRQVHTIVSNHAIAAGVREDRCHPHALRHTFCTQLARNGVGIEVIQKLAGHADISTTTIYTETPEGQLVDAIASSEPARAWDGLE